MGKKIMEMEMEMETADLWKGSILFILLSMI